VEARHSCSAFYYWQKKSAKFIREELSKILLSDEIQDVIMAYTQSEKESRTESEENREEEEEKSLTRNQKIKNKKRRKH
jgi:hypothetical protein